VAGAKGGVEREGRRGGLQWKFVLGPSGSGGSARRREVLARGQLVFVARAPPTARMLPTARRSRAPGTSVTLEEERGEGGHEEQEEWGHEPERVQGGSGEAEAARQRQGVRGYVEEVGVVWRGARMVRVRMLGDDEPRTHPYATHSNRARGRAEVGLHGGGAGRGDGVGGGAGRCAEKGGSDEPGAGGVAGSAAFRCLHFHASELERVYARGSLVVVPETENYRRLGLCPLCGFGSQV
jgi:hypothetical protein